MCGLKARQVAYGTHVLPTQAQTSNVSHLNPVVSFKVSFKGSTCVQNKPPSL